MSRIRDAVMSASDANTVALGELIGDSGFRQRNAQRWDRVRRFIVKREEKCDISSDDVHYGIVLERAMKALHATEISVTSALNIG